jgi:putative ubiquitin-RnfH superfamily antitoxin RatB of RatAB toxin-antitoxin module
MVPAERQPPGVLTIEVVVGLAPRQIVRIPLTLPAGSTVKQALEAANVWGLADSLHPEAIESGAWTVSVWGRRERLGHVLRDQDRIELVRPLIVDPKEARRVRYRAHGEKLPKVLQRDKPR